jgi:LytS/YehU family sensor histidine kinase
VTFLFWYYLGQQYGESATLSARFNQIVLWYLSFLWFIPAIITVVQRYIRPKQNWKSLLFKHVLLLLGFVLCYSFSAGGVIFLITGELANQESFTTGVIRVIETNSWPYDLTMYVAIVLSAYVNYFFSQSKLKETQNARLESELYKTQLTALRSQLNPHFLFNALNTISGLVRMNKRDKATNAIAELSYMLRSVLVETDSHLVPLIDEITFIHRYLHFQKLRFNERLDVIVNIAEESESFKIPFLLIHTLVENAVTHGSQFSTINHIELSTSVENNILCVDLLNSIETEQRDNGFGIGLLNCHKRLQLLYKERYLLESKIDEHNRYHIHIEIQGDSCDV